nr:MAG TPA: hypothetical protein [Caudoviricetes sp.]
MKQTRGRGIDNPGGAFADDGEPLQDTGSVHIREPLYRHSSRPTAEIIVGKSTAPQAPYTWEAT